VEGRATFPTRATSRCPTCGASPPRRLAASLPRDRELVVQCLGGYRSSIACSLLEQHGFTRLVDLEGGWRAWEAAGGAVAR